MAGESIGYITRAQADSYIKTGLPSKQKRRLCWETLTDSDAEACLKLALNAIEGLVFPGSRKAKDQPLSFPREGQAGVPEDVKLAQAYEACTRALSGDEDETRARLRSQGVASFTAGSLSEHYTKGAKALFSSEAQTLLRRYICGVSALD